MNLTPGESVNLTIGADMAFGDTKTIDWYAMSQDGKEKNGSLTFRKVDPNASIIVYVKANSAPNLYAWVEGGEKAKVLNGEWPGKKMSTKTTIEGVDYYMFVADGVEKFNIILNNGSGAQTGDITDITATTFLSYDGGSGYKILTDIPVPDPNRTRILIQILIQNQTQYLSPIQLASSMFTLQLLHHGQQLRHGYGTTIMATRTILVAIGQARIVSRPLRNTTA